MRLFLCLLVLIFLAPATASASGNFLLASEATYRVIDAEEVQVIHQISLTNTKTEIYATDYTLALKGAKPTEITASDAGQALQTELSYDGDVALVKVVFNRPVVGVGQRRDFSVEYKEHSIVETTGEVKEINIPRLADEEEFESYQLRLIIPNTFGEASYLSPEPDNKLVVASETTYYFDKSKLQKAGVTAAFGDFQVFSFDLTYHLQNPLAIGTKMEIALPPDTAFQKVAFESLNPAPDSIHQDEDGNWIAVFGLRARERLDVRAIGSAQIYASALKKDVLTDKYREENLSATEFWQVDDPRIKKLAAELKTPKAIFDYVVESLSYNYDKVTEGPLRLGALGALDNPSRAICTEFTDLFVAIARAAGIPAREVNGYAYTDNSSLKPLSLVADVLHAWPEYWDVTAEIWRPVDPTWTKTTGGIDYFSKLDMRHMTFVIHGADSVLPIPPGSYKLGSNPQKDVYVSFGDLIPAQTRASVSISQKTTLPFQGVSLYVDVANPGPSALYNQNVEIYFDEKVNYKDRIDVILPYEKKSLQFTVPYGFMGSQMPRSAKIRVGDSESSYSTDKQPAVYRDLFSILVTVILFLLGGYTIAKRLRK